MWMCAPNISHIYIFIPRSCTHSKWCFYLAGRSLLLLLPHQERRYACLRVCIYSYVFPAASIQRKSKFGGYWMFPVLPGSLLLNASSMDERQNTTQIHPYIYIYIHNYTWLAWTSTYDYVYLVYYIMSPTCPNVVFVQNSLFVRTTRLEWMETNSIQISGVGFAMDSNMNTVKQKLLALSSFQIAYQLQRGHLGIHQHQMNILYNMMAAQNNRQIFKMKININANNILLYIFMWDF